MVTPRAGLPWTSSGSRTKVGKGAGVQGEGRCFRKGRMGRKSMGRCLGSTTPGALPCPLVLRTTPTHTHSHRCALLLIAPFEMRRLTQVWPLLAEGTQGKRPPPIVFWRIISLPSTSRATRKAHERSTRRTCARIAPQAGEDTRSKATATATVAGTRRTCPSSGNRNTNLTTWCPGAARVGIRRKTWPGGREASCTIHGSGEVKAWSTCDKAQAR